MTIKLEEDWIVSDKAGVDLTLQGHLDSGFLWTSCLNTLPSAAQWFRRFDHPSCAKFWSVHRLQSQVGQAGEIRVRRHC